MMNLLRSEFLKLRTVRLNIVLLVFGVAFVVVILALVGVFAPTYEEGFGDGPTSGDLASTVGISAVLSGLLMSVVSALSVTAEFGYGTIRPTLVATPNRVKVFGGKAIVLAIMAPVIGAVTGLLAYLVGYGLQSGRGADIKLFDSDGTVSVLLGLPVFYLILAMFGFGLGLLIRNSPASVAALILWPLIIEDVLLAVLNIAGVENPSKFLPYQSAFALLVADSDEFGLGRVGGALYFGAVVVVLGVVAIFINTRRDV